MDGGDVSSEDSYRIAVYGASGAMGRELLVALEGEGLPISKLTVVGGPGTAGGEVAWRNRGVPLTALADVDTDDLDLAILAVPRAVAEGQRRALVEAGALVIDLASGSGWPLVWPELGTPALDSHPGGLALPCAIASTLAPVLTSLSEIGTLASVAGTVLVGGGAGGRRGEESLSAQTVALLGHKMPPDGPFGGVLAFNVIPGSHRAQAGASSDPVASGPGAPDPVTAEAGAQLAELVAAFRGPMAAGLHLEVVQIPIFAGMGIQLTCGWTGEVPALEAILRAIDASSSLLRVPDGLALRDAVERDEVFVARVHADEVGRLHLFLGADPVHRIAQATATLVSRVIAEDLW